MQQPNPQDMGAPASPVPDQVNGDAGGDPIKPLQDLGASLSGLMPAMQDAGAPKEVLAPLQKSIDSYGQFLSMLTGQGSGAQQVPTTDMNEAAGSQPANY
jgi:hypothetical protein